MARLWSIGYEGHSPESFLATLHRHGIDALADVRELPLSRKKGFSKRALAETLAASGVSYVHFRDLGALRDVRHEYHATGDRVAFHAAYGHHLESQRVALDQLESFAMRRRLAMMCVEADPTECHRYILARHLEADGHTVTDILG